MAIFRFIYEPSEYNRIINAILIDARATIPAIKNQIGDVIKAYCDVEVAKVTDDTFADILFFRIETIYTGGATADGVLAGYFSLFVSKRIPHRANLYQIQLRPPFYQNSTAISAQISLFLSNGEYRQYYLS